MLPCDFVNKSSNVALGFLVQATHYNDTNMNTGGDHAIESASSAAQTRLGGGSQPWRFYMTLNGWTRP